MKYQVITIGSALVDVFIHTHQFELMDTPRGTLLCQLHGSKTEVDNFEVFTGGGGSNTAVGFARLGFKTGVICETGRDNFSHLVIKDLKDNGVDTSLVISEKAEKTGGSVILICENGERSILVHRGASALLDPFDVSAYWLSQAELVHLGSIGGRKKTLEKIFLSISKSESTKLSWNPGKAELMMLADRDLLARDVPCEIFVVNDEEWELIQDVQGAILNQFPYVVVTAGKKGGEVYYQGKHELHFPALSSSVVDTTGAGDSFCVGFVSGLLWQKTPKEAAILGTKNAASVVAKYGAKAGLLTKNLILQET